MHLADIRITVVVGCCVEGMLYSNMGKTMIGVAMIMLYIEVC